MAKNLVMELECDRCKRVEVIDKDTATNLSTSDPVLSLKLNDALGGTHKEVMFIDLCSPCRHAVTQLVEQIGKKIDGKSPDRKKA